jgi:hypothetical protein
MMSEAIHCDDSCCVMKLMLDAAVLLLDEEDGVVAVGAGALIEGELVEGAEVEGGVDGVDGVDGVVVLWASAPPATRATSAVAVRNFFMGILPIWAQASVARLPCYGPTGRA